MDLTTSATTTPSTISVDMTEQPTLSSLMNTLNEINEIMTNTHAKIEYAIDESKPRDVEDKESKQQSVSLHLMSQRIHSLRRLASETAEMTSKLLGN